MSSQKRSKIRSALMSRTERSIFLRRGSRKNSYAGLSGSILLPAALRTTWGWRGRYCLGRVGAGAGGGGWCFSARDGVDGEGGLVECLDGGGADGVLGLGGGSNGGDPGFGGGGKGADGVVCVDGLLDECGEVLGAVVKSC